MFGLRPVTFQKRRSNPLRDWPHVWYLAHNYLQRDSGSRIMMRSATDLGKADLQVFSKLFDDGLERGQEAEAFSWRQIGGHDDVLEFLVGHLINVEMTRQPAP